MKLLRLVTAYPEYIKQFYSIHSGLETKSYVEQKKWWNYDSSPWSDTWTSALRLLGHETKGIIVNARQLQKTWANENLPKTFHGTFEDIALAQIKKFKPDVLWFVDYNLSLLKRIRSEVSSVRFILGWVGSAIPKTTIWNDMDLILSCAPETVQYFKSKGYPAIHIHHGFDPRVNSRINHEDETIGCSFIGGLIRNKGFHLYREKIIEQLIDSGIDLQIYSPSSRYNKVSDSLQLTKIAFYMGTKFLKNVGVKEELLRFIPIIKKTSEWESRPMLLVSKKIKPHISQMVFGLKMFQTLKNSQINLNVHADSSPNFASNMKLFETTGVGTCLITDWKKNLYELFEPDIEIISYKSIDECVEKIKWLMAHHLKREEIARAGLSRVLNQHTFLHRAEQLEEILHDYI